MNNLAWVAILRQIPAEKLSQFTIVTNGNIEITLQSLLRLENEFAVIKGRLAGSQDAGRVFFVPYEHMINIGTLYPIKDEDYEAIFGTLIIPDAAPVAPPPPPPPPPVRALPVPEQVHANGANGLHNQNGAAPMDSSGRSSIRSEVLDRFRARPNAPSSSVNLPNPRQG